jgi:O-methyltransferase involved in polyketide biosynthesis
MHTLLTELAPVEQVALLALRFRALDARSATPILGDHLAEQVAEAIGLDLTSPKIPRSVVLVHAVRARTLDRLVRRFIEEHPDAVVVDLGCGLDSRRHRVSPPPGTDWYDVDLPTVIRLRERFLPDDPHRVPADVTSSNWLRDVPRNRPTMVLTDGLMALLTRDEFIGLARTVNDHFASGELVFNAYSRLAMRNSRRLRRGPLSMPIAGEGIDDPLEPETWDAQLSLIEELSMSCAPEVSQYPPLLRTIAHISARSKRMIRVGDRVVHYRFPT